MEHRTDEPTAGRLPIRLFGDPEVRSDAGLCWASATGFRMSTISWRSDAPADVDVVDFERLLAPTDGPVGEAELVRAVSLYAGDLLSGGYDEWVDTERERLRRSYVDALHALVGLAERMDPSSGENWSNVGGR